MVLGLGENAMKYRSCDLDPWCFFSTLPCFPLGEGSLGSSVSPWEAFDRMHCCW